MKLKNRVEFQIKALNQEKMLNEMSKAVPLQNIDRTDKAYVKFSCSIFDERRVENFLKNQNATILRKKRFGILSVFKKILSSYGLIAGIVLCSVLYFVQANFIWNYKIFGAENLSQNQIEAFVKTNFPRNKRKFRAKDVEIALVDEFKQISFVSCAVRGQSVVINLKEKLQPDEIYGSFKPIVAQKSGRIEKINLISGTLKVKVGDFVKAGDVLVEPFTTDTSGQTKKVEAHAEILAKVYHQGRAEHSEKRIDVVRTGNVVHQNKIKLFGLEIYSFKEENNFKMFDVEEKQKNLIKNLPLPFKMTEVTIFELKENVIESKFEDVKDEYVEKARQNALKNCEKCDTIIEEFYTTKSLAGITIVNFCIVTEQEIGGFNEN